ncbi:hypothetical protein [Pseudomonas anguilliseptica]|uniref:hypothetical protein n=1 Tax=Pseudomonas anguilliseptica TaxID=53406 RepID=UPI0022AF640D|nr:hypothetical protein [Pseudomonas anguilliseptica]MCZ4324559.1 hypothetical protein [Pseudomonas anguilliseptica]
MNSENLKPANTLLWIIISSIFGYLLFGILGDRPIHGVSEILLLDVLFPVLMFSSLGFFAGFVGILRNRTSKVEINLNQVFPYFFATLGFLAAHLTKNGLNSTSDVGTFTIALLITLFLIGSIKNAMLVIHNAKLDRANQ